MEEPITPEEDLNQELHQQERDIHGNLFLINQLVTFCSDESISTSDMYQKCKPILEKMQKSNPVVAREIEKLLKKGSREELLTYFEKEKQDLIQILGDEMKQHEGISKRINEEKKENFPTDS